MPRILASVLVVVAALLGSPAAHAYTKDELATISKCVRMAFALSGLTAESALHIGLTDKVKLPKSLDEEGWSAEKALQTGDYDVFVVQSAGQTVSGFCADDFIVRAAPETTPAAPQTADQSSGATGSEAPPVPTDSTTGAPVQVAPPAPPPAAQPPQKAQGQPVAPPAEPGAQPTQTKQEDSNWIWTKILDLLGGNPPPGQMRWGPAITYGALACMALIIIAVMWTKQRSGRRTRSESVLSPTPVARTEPLPLVAVRSAEGSEASGRISKLPTTLIKKIPLIVAPGTIKEQLSEKERTFEVQLSLVSTAGLDEGKAPFCSVPWRTMVIRYGWESIVNDMFTPEGLRYFEGRRMTLNPDADGEDILVAPPPTLEKLFGKAAA